MTIINAIDGAPSPLAARHAPPHAPAMFVVTEADAAAIRAVYQQRGEFAAALELRRRFPGITDTAQRASAPGPSPAGSHCCAGRSRGSRCCTSRSLPRIGPAELSTLGAMVAVRSQAISRR